MLVPCFDDEDQYRKAYNMKPTPSFFLKRHELENEIHFLQSSAQAFIYSYYKSVQDWSGLDCRIRAYDVEDKKKQIDILLASKGYKPIKIGDLTLEIHDKHIAIETFDEVVIDPSDGDMAFKINGKFYNCVTGDIELIADYINEQLGIYDTSSEDKK